MQNKSNESIQVEWHDVTLLERFSSVLYPLDTLELLKRLPAIGYVVPELVLRGTLEQGIPLASKGEAELLINEQNKTVGVKGRDPERVVEDYKELRTFYEQQLDPSPGLARHYVELNAIGWARSRHNPVEMLSIFWHACSPLQKLCTAVGAPVTNFGLQLVPPRTDPNQPDWFHFYIEPLVAASSRRYRLRCTWRGVNVDEMLTKFTGVTEMFRRLVLLVEGR